MSSNILFGLMLSLTQPYADLSAIQENASHISIVDVSRYYDGRELILKASFVKKVRGNGKADFRIWLLGSPEVSDGRYVIFYNLCGDIGYPVLELAGLYKVSNKRIEVFNKGFYESVKINCLGDWLNRNGFFLRTPDYQCLPGRKGLERVNAQSGQK